MNHGRGHNILILTLLSLIFGFLALLFAPSSLSPIYQGLDFGHNDLDGNFFLYLGYGYTHGLKPYVDLFDHKGMYIFWIEGLGALMGGKNGMFVIMSLYMCANFFCYNLIFREMGYEKTVSYLLSSIIGIILSCFAACGGHHTGDLLNPFFSVTVLFYIRAIMRSSEKDFLFASSFAGFSAGLSFLSRPSEAALPLGFVVFFFVYWLRKEKKDLSLLWNAFLAIAFFFLPIGVSFLEALIRGFFKEMLDSMVFQNFSYVSKHWDLSRIIASLETTFLVSLSLGLLFYHRKKVQINLFLFFFIGVLTDGIMQIFISRYINYWISFLPFALIGLFASYIQKDFNKKIRTISFSSIGVIYFSFSLFFCLTSFLMKEPLIVGGLELRASYHTNKICEKNLDELIEKKDPNHEKEIYVLDGNPACLLYLNRTSSCKYNFLSSWWSLDNPKINEEVLAYFKEKEPYWIITSSKENEENDVYAYVHANYQEIGNDFYYTYWERK